MPVTQEVVGSSPISVAGRRPMSRHGPSLYIARYIWAPSPADWLGPGRPGGRVKSFVLNGSRKRRRLQVRMGIDSGPVNEITDINEQANIAGAGI